MLYALFRTSNEKENFNWVVAVATIAAVNITINSQSSDLYTLSLANVEALAQENERIYCAIYRVKIEMEGPNGIIAPDGYFIENLNAIYVTTPFIPMLYKYKVNKK
jgi:hypothetical protein